MGHIECDVYGWNVRLDDLTHTFYPTYSHVLMMSLIYLLLGFMMQGLLTETSHNGTYRV